MLLGQFMAINSPFIFLAKNPGYHAHLRATIIQNQTSFPHEVRETQFFLISETNNFLSVRCRSLKNQVEHSRAKRVPEIFGNCRLVFYSGNVILSKSGKTLTKIIFSVSFESVNSVKTVKNMCS